MDFRRAAGREPGSAEYVQLQQVFFVGSGLSISGRLTSTFWCFFFFHRFLFLLGGSNYSDSSDG